MGSTTPEAVLTVPVRQWVRVHAWALAVPVLCCGLLHVHVPLVGKSMSLVTTVLAFVLLLGLAGAELLASGRLMGKPVAGTTVGLWAAFCGFACLSALWGGVPPLYVQHLMVWGAALGGMAVGRSFAYRAGFAVPFLRQVLPLLLAVLVAVEVAAIGLRRPFVELVIHERTFAIAALLPLAGLAAWVRNQPSRWGLALVLLVAGWVVEGLSLSRMGFFLSSGILVVALVPARRTWQPLAWLAAAAVVLAAAALLGFVIEPALGDRFFHGPSDDPSGYSTMGRSKAWAFLLQERAQAGWATHLVGAGTGQASNAIEGIYSWMDHPLNEYLRVLFDLGLVGLGLYLVNLVSWLVAPFRLAANAAATPAERALGTTGLLSVACFAFLTLTDNGLVYIYVLLPLAVLLGLCQGHYARISNQQRVPLHPKQETAAWGQVLALRISRLPFQATVEEIAQRAAGRQGGYYCFANAHMNVEALRSAAFADQVNAAVRVCADGVPVVWAQRLLYRKRIERVAGMDVLPALLDACAARQLSVYFYGGAPQVLDALRAVLAQRWPTLPVAGLHSPPFRHLTEDEVAADLDQINASGAALVVVALGCPKQETWMATHTHALQAVLLGLGGAVPVLAGAAKRAPVWMRTAGLEWLHRWAQEPRRLFRRYAETNTVFALQLLRQWLLARRG